MKIPKRVSVVPITGTARPAHRIFIDSDEFPYGTKVGSLKTESLNIEGSKMTWVTLTFLVDGDVVIPDSYKPE